MNALRKALNDYQQGTRLGKTSTLPQRHMLVETGSISFGAIDRLEHVGKTEPNTTLAKSQDAQIIQHFEGVIPTARQFFKSWGPTMIKAGNTDPSTDFYRMLKSLLDGGMSRQEVCQAVGMSDQELAAFSL